ncbi:MotA/TolQ/ExbB proton channel family protein [bacterium]|nr:MAG: MotA/TolQ/ExbB proton channel family protein [bacterium]
MKKSGTFTAIVVTVAIVVSIIVHVWVFGNVKNFKDTGNLTPAGWTGKLGSIGGYKTVDGKDPSLVPANLLGTVYLGGFVVPILLTLSIMVVTYTIERYLSLNKAKGRGKIEVFLKDVQLALKDGKIEEAVSLCDNQRGSIANIIKQGIERYQTLAFVKDMDAEKKLEEVKNAIEEAMGLEIPLLNTNLPVIATIASISVLFGLFGTVLGMIRSFAAMSSAGTPNASELSAGISEALINTAFGLFGAIVGTISYNFFLTKVGNITYMIDEATYNLLSILAIRSK